MVGGGGWVDSPLPWQQDGPFVDATANEGSLETPEKNKQTNKQTIKKEHPTSMKRNSIRFIDFLMPSDGPSSVVVTSDSIFRSRVFPSGFTGFYLVFFRSGTTASTGAIESE